jgi:hypothetical protein
MRDQERIQADWLTLGLSDEIRRREELVHMTFRGVDEELATEAPDPSLAHLDP